MAIKTCTPTSAGRRWQTFDTFEGISTERPVRGLVEPLHKTGGRNAYGRITSRHRGGGHKRLYRLIDFKRDKLEIPARVARIEYDPNRTTRIALLTYADGEKRYILAPAKLKVGDLVVSSPHADIKPGNTLPLANIPMGTHVHNLELQPGKGGQMVRSAGTYAQLMAKEGKYAQIKMPSGEVRKVLLTCKATIGQNGQFGTGKYHHRQGRPKPLAGKTAPVSGGGHESGGSPAWRRGRKEFGRTPSGDSLGCPDQGVSDPEKQGQ